MPNIQLTQDYVKFLFDYKNGELIWRQSIGSKQKKGQFAGCLMKSKGYMVVGINGNTYLSHQIIFLWHHGYIPKMIDHIDRNRVNNWIENLRECSPEQNQANRTHAELGKYKGVRKNKMTGDKFGAFIKGRIIGLFECELSAAKAYNEEAIKEYGDFAFLNKA